MCCQSKQHLVKILRVILFAHISGNHFFLLHYANDETIHMTQSLEFGAGKLVFFFEFTFGSFISSVPWWAGGKVQFYSTEVFLTMKGESSVFSLLPSCWGRILLCSPHWLWTENPLACTTIPACRLFKYWVEAESLFYFDLSSSSIFAESDYHSSSHQIKSWEYPDFSVLMFTFQSADNVWIR